ncbi:MAG: pyridoxal-phosphate dependent enzyme [Balneolaceae bacterium]|nr:pyridoxal-phosphate dependent enzyme [Balneolaceae bacterium]
MGADRRKNHALCSRYGHRGTISGVAKFLKEQNSEIQVAGIDSVGSVYKHYFETGEFDKSVIHSYLTEGIGEDILPKNMDFDLLDEVVQVNDKNALTTTRRLAREEGLFVGGSCGAAVYGALEYINENQFSEDDLMVIILPDGGSQYVSKIYNNDWMKEKGLLD